MTPEFAQSVNKIFDTVLDLIDRIEARERPDLAEEKRSIRTELDALTARSGNSSSRTAEEMELAQRVLIYWVDEVLTAAHIEWKAMTLEFDYFGERNRAWRFYEFGERKAKSSSPDVIETWYLCLVLGFEGDIGEAFEEHLHRALPGGATRSADARKAWAGELARLIRKSSLPEYTGEPISGNVQPLVGATWLQTMAICLAVACVLLFVLAPISWRLSR